MPQANPSQNSKARTNSLHFAIESEDEDEESSTFIPRESAATATKLPSTASKKKRKSQANSDDDDTDQEEVREPLAERIHQNRQSIRTEHHQTMTKTGYNSSGKKRRVSKGPASKKQNREQDDYNDGMSMEEVASYRAKMRLHAQSAAKSIVVSDSVATAIKDCVNRDLWKFCKFIKNEDFLRKATNYVMQKLDLKELKGLSDKDTIKEEEIWKEVHGPTVREALNKHRNYVSGEIQKVYYEALKKPDTSHLPNPKEIKQLMQRLKLDESTDDDEREVMEKKFVTYVNDLLPKVAGNKWWGPGTRHYYLPSTCKHDIYVPPDARGLDCEIDGVSPSDEAFLVVVVENSFAKWSAQAAKYKESVTARKADPKAALFLPKADKTDYDLKCTNPKAGNAKFGGWREAGVTRYDKLKKQVVQNRVNERDYLEAVERDTLVKIQQKVGILKENEDKPKKKKASKGSLMAAFADEDAGDENDFGSW